MAQDFSKIHYKKCRYPACNLTSRDGVLGLTFHAFPVRQADRCIKWLVNCGLDDWVEMSEKELKIRYICSRHFTDDNFYATGRLKREAVPIILGMENPSLKSNKKGNKLRKVMTTEADFLKKQIEKLEVKLEKERQKKAEIRAKLCATRVALSRLKSKLNEGTFQDIFLNKALANRLEGFVLTFFRMQLFHKPSTCYTTDEQRLCMMMYCISPALYSKMRDDFKFVLPNEITMVRWFNKLNISPKKASLSGSFNFEKIEQMLREERENRLVTVEEAALEENIASQLNEYDAYKDSDEMQDTDEENESEEDESNFSEKKMLRLTVKHLQTLEKEDEQMEVLEALEEEKFVEEHLEVLEDEGQDLGMGYQEGETIIPDDGDVDSSEYVSVAYYKTRDDGALTPVSYTEERDESSRSAQILDLENHVDDVEEYTLIEELEEVDECII